MTSCAPPPPEPASTSAGGAGCISLMMGLVGVIMLLPGACSLIFMFQSLVSEGGELLYRDGLVVMLWIATLVISVCGFYLVRAASHRGP